MTAEEIRKQDFEHDDGNWECAHWLREIAAQLAELNANAQNHIKADRELSLQILRGEAT